MATSITGSPGITIYEEDLSTYVVEDGSTAAAIVGEFEWGPVSSVTNIRSEGQLIATFGYPTSDQYDVDGNVTIKGNYKDWFCARNYLYYSNNLQVVRVIEKGTFNACLTRSSERDSIVVKNKEDFDAIISNDGMDTNYQVIARYPGERGNNIFVSIIDYKTVQDVKLGVLSGNDVPYIYKYVSSKRLNPDDIIVGVWVVDHDTTIEEEIARWPERNGPTEYGIYSRSEGNTDFIGYPNYFVKYINETSKYIFINPVGIDFKDQKTGKNLAVNVNGRLSGGTTVSNEFKSISTAQATRVVMNSDEVSLLPAYDKNGNVIESKSGKFSIPSSVKNDRTFGVNALKNVVVEDDVVVNDFASKDPSEQVVTWENVNGSPLSSMSNVEKRRGYFKYEVDTESNFINTLSVGESFNEKFKYSYLDCELGKVEGTVAVKIVKENDPHDAFIRPKKSKDSTDMLYNVIVKPVLNVLQTEYAVSYQDGKRYIDGVIDSIITKDNGTTAVIKHNITNLMNFMYPPLVETVDAENNRRTTRTVLSLAEAFARLDAIHWANEADADKKLFVNNPLHTAELNELKVDYASKLVLRNQLYNWLCSCLDTVIAALELDGNSIAKPKSLSGFLGIELKANATPNVEDTKGDGVFFNINKLLEDMKITEMTFKSTKGTTDIKQAFQSADEVPVFYSSNRDEAVNANYGKLSAKLSAQVMSFFAEGVVYTDLEKRETTGKDYLWGGLFFVAYPEGSKTPEYYQAEYLPANNNWDWSVSIKRTYNFTSEKKVNVTASRTTAYKRGWDLFANEEAEEFTTQLLIQGGADVEIGNYMIQLAHTRGDCLACVSPRESECVLQNVWYVADNSEDVSEEEFTSDKIIEKMTCEIPGRYGSAAPVFDAGHEESYIFSSGGSGDMAGSYAFMDGNYKYQYDPWNDCYRWLPLNGDIAGIFAEIDQYEKPWISPGNHVIKNCVKLAFYPTKAQRDSLFDAYTNAVTNFHGEGNVLYGDWTRISNTSFNFVGVRRMFLYVERVIKEYARDIMFNQNDDITRTIFVQRVEPFLREVQAGRGIQEYKIYAGSDITSPEEMDRGIFKAKILLKPVRSIRYIILTFSAVRSDISIEEAV